VLPLMAVISSQARQLSWDRSSLVCYLEVAIWVGNADEKAGTRSVLRSDTLAVMLTLYVEMRYGHIAFWALHGNWVNQAVRHASARRRSFGCCWDWVGSGSSLLFIIEVNWIISHLNLDIVE
jgi:hypothetical protein